SEFLSTPSLKNKSLRRLLKSALCTPPSRLGLRAYRDRHERGARDAVDAAAHETKRADRGRRSRVVLTPRRWRQVGDNASHYADDSGKKARSLGRARRKPLKPLRRE